MSCKSVRKLYFFATFLLDLRGIRDFLQSCHRPNYYHKHYFYHILCLFLPKSLSSAVSSAPSSVVVFSTLKCESLFLYTGLFLTTFINFGAYRPSTATIWQILRQAALGASALDSLKDHIVYIVSSLTISIGA